MLGISLLVLNPLKLMHRATRDPRGKPNVHQKYQKSQSTEKKLPTNARTNENQFKNSI